jgi:serine/threonine protein kinase
VPAPALERIALEYAEKVGLTDIEYKGKGNFKETYRATTCEGEFIALKILDPQKCSLERSQREIQTMMKCDTPLIAKLYDHGSFSAKNGQAYYFCIEEYMDGGSLAEQLSSGILKPNIVHQYAVSLIEALDYLKNISLVHRDIKPENIMFRSSSNVPVLVDLGIARDLSESSLTPSWLPHGPGTPFYSAPEQLNNEKHLINWRTDQFSLGIVIGICLTGIHPFSEKGMTKGDTVAAVADRKLCTSDFAKRASDLSFGFVVKMLDPWPHRRHQSPAELLEDIRR